VDEGATETGWALVEQFDRVAREPGAVLELDLVSAFLEYGSAAMVEALFDAFEQVCLRKSEAEARQYAGCLEMLAAAMDEPGGRAVLAVVDLRLGWACVGSDDDEARERAERAAPHLAELWPDLVPDLYALRAGLAEADNRPGDARAHWEQARDGYAAAERWGEGACAAHGAAQHASTLTHAVVAEWRTAARWYLRSGDADAAADCAEQAAAALVRAWSSFGEGDEQQARELAEQVAELAQEHGHPVIAAHARAVAASLAVESEEPWSVVCAVYDDARAAYDVVELDADERRTAMARIDGLHGMAAFSRGMQTEAEILLSRALPGLRVAGATDEAELVESQLTMIVNATNRAVSPMRTPPGHSTETRAAALIAEGAQLCGRGALDTGVRLLEEAGRLHAAAGNPDAAVALDGFAGTMRALAGDPRAGEAALQRLEEHVRARGDRSTRAGRVLLTGSRGTLRWTLARLARDRDRWLAELARTEGELLADGAHLPAADLALVRGHDLAQAGRPAEALAVVLPAVLALDTHRCVLPDARRRSSWAARVAAGFDTAARAAAACGETRLLAELLEVARGNAIPTPRPLDVRDDAISALGAAFFPESTAGFAEGVRPGAAAAVGGTERTALGLPALIRTPWGSIALAAALDRAGRYRDPLRAAAVAEWGIPGAPP
jgi:hypothetical protein